MRHKSDDIIENYLHINCRFDQKCLILNSRLNNIWSDDVQIKPGGIIRIDSDFSCIIGILDEECLVSNIIILHP